MDELEHEIESLKSRTSENESSKGDLKFETQADLLKFTEEVTEATQSNASTINIIASSLMQQAQKLLFE